MKAFDRTLKDWFEIVEKGQITLPRFQRWEAWDHGKVAELLNTVLADLPAGATLILEVGDEELFESRSLNTAPEKAPRVFEQLLDGQQRLTALWRSLKDTYRDSDNRTFFVQVPDSDDEITSSVPEVICERFSFSKNNEYLPSYLRTPKSQWDKRRIPLSLLCPGDLNKEVNDWIRSAIPQSEDFEETDRVRDNLRNLITNLRQRIREFNLPHLSLPSGTPKEVALDVFVKMNTSSVRLSTFDIVRALVEFEGESLNDLADSLSNQVPGAARYASIERLILDVTALMQGHEAKEIGYKKIDYPQMVSEWPLLVHGIGEMVRLLEEECIFDMDRLPSYPPLPVIAALFTKMPTDTNKMGDAKQLLRRYLWNAFLTNRYESSSGTRHFGDFKGMRHHITGTDPNAKIPIFDSSEHRVPTYNDIALAPWPSKNNILARGLLALSFKSTALDIVDGTPISEAQVGKREYHHLFPNSTLRDLGLADKSFRFLNCAFIWWQANRTISNKPPVQYLKDRIEKSQMTDKQLRARLRSHLIPFDELNISTHDDVSPPTKRAKAVAADYQRFCDARNQLFQVAAQLACDGEIVSADRVFSRIQKQE